MKSASIRLLNKQKITVTMSSIIPLSFFLFRILKFPFTEKVDVALSANFSLNLFVLSSLSDESVLFEHALMTFAISALGKEQISLRAIKKESRSKPDSMTF